jgi:uncharacterized protein with PIN domain
MADKVVDASALAAILFNEPEGDNVAEQLRGGRLKAPALLEFELANVCLLKCKRHPEDSRTLVQAFRLRHEFGAEHVEVDCDSALRMGSPGNLAGAVSPTTFRLIRFKYLIPWDAA